MRCFKAAAGLCALLLMCSCAGKGSGGNGDDLAVTEKSGTDADDGEQAFSEYTAKVTDGENKYLLTISYKNGMLSASLENNRYEAYVCGIEPPEGFQPLLPKSEKTSRDICRIITNDVDDTKVIPDIIRFGFTDGSKNVYRYYSISAGELRMITVYDTDKPGERASVCEYLQGSTLYHSEADKFIAGIVVDESAGIVSDIGEMVKIHTLKFDPVKLEFRGKFEKLSENDPLYFGYAYWGLANNAAVHFTETPFNVTDHDNFIEMADDAADNGVLYYFHVDDPRFYDTSDVMEYLEKIFSEDTARRIFSRAPQKYRDINGELCTLLNESYHDTSLGMLTFRSYYKSRDGKSITYYTRQEKYDENGVFIGYTDGGDFRIDKLTEWLYDEENDRYYAQDRWVVVSYRYPYS